MSMEGLSQPTGLRNNLYVYSQADVNRPQGVVFESSLLTMITALFRTIIARLSSASTRVANIPHYQEILNESPYGEYAGLLRLMSSKGHFFSDTDATSLFHYLEEQHPEFMHVSVPRGMNNGRPLMQMLESRLDDLQRRTSTAQPTKFGIEIDNDGHFVQIFIDVDRGTVEYFDPKGATSSAPESQRGELNLWNELKNIQAGCTGRFGKNFTIVENTRQHQDNHWSCSIYAAWYAEQRLEGRTPEEIATGPVFANSEIIAYQNNIAQRIAESVLKKPSDTAQSVRHSVVGI